MLAGVGIGSARPINLSPSLDTKRMKPGAISYSLTTPTGCEKPKGVTATTNPDPLVWSSFCLYYVAVRYIDARYTNQRSATVNIFLGTRAVLFVYGIKTPTCGSNEGFGSKPLPSCRGCRAASPHKCCLPVWGWANVRPCTPSRIARNPKQNGQRGRKCPRRSLTLNKTHCYRTRSLSFRFILS